VSRPRLPGRLRWTPIASQTRFQTESAPINPGGTPQQGARRQLNFGMASFRLMDGGQPPTGGGLATLGGRYLFPASFVEGPTVFGQGAEMQVRKFGVRSRVAGTSDGDRHGQRPS